MGLSRCEYYSKVFGCWLGKTCGGTLGARSRRPLVNASSSMFGGTEPSGRGHTQR